MSTEVQTERMTIQVSPDFKAWAYRMQKLYCMN